VAVFGLGDDEARQEGPDASEAPRRGEPRHGQADHHDGQQEQFAAARPGDLEQGPGDDPLGRDDEGQDDPDLLRQHAGQVVGRPLDASPEEGEQQHHGATMGPGR
jgi:hypothetical protein